MGRWFTPQGSCGTASYPIESMINWARPSEIGLEALVIEFHQPGLRLVGIGNGRRTFSGAGVVVKVDSLVHCAPLDYPI